MVMLVRPVQQKKTRPPILVTELGMVKLVRPVQLSKAELPILVTELGMVNDALGLLTGY